MPPLILGPVGLFIAIVAAFIVGAGAAVVVGLVFFVCLLPIIMLLDKRESAKSKKEKRLRDEALDREYDFDSLGEKELFELASSNFRHDYALSQRALYHYEIRKNENKKLLDDANRSIDDKHNLRRINQLSLYDLAYNGELIVDTNVRRRAIEVLNERYPDRDELTSH